MIHEKLRWQKTEYIIMRCKMRTAMRIDFKHITTTIKGKCDSQKQKKRKQPVRWLGWLEKAFNSKNNVMAKNKSKNVHR